MSYFLKALLQQHVPDPTAFQEVPQVSDVEETER